MEKKPDFTFIAVTRQLKAMGMNRYEVGIYDRSIDKMIPRLWTSEKLLTSISFLKQKNISNHDIFIRPEGSSGLIFFDDLSRLSLKQLEIDGFRPAVTIQSSPDNFHGWIRVSEQPISEKLGTAIAKVLADKYRSDKNSADWRHYGRLAGFTNRKDQYIDNSGKRPFVLLQDGNGNLAKNATLLISMAEKYITFQESIENERIDKINSKKEQISNTENRSITSDSYYESQLKGIINKYGKNFNKSKADWMIVNRMLMRGYTEDEIYTTLLTLSPAVEKRGKYGVKYVSVTLDVLYGRTQSDESS